jgi:hypothetical protein
MFIRALLVADGISTAGPTACAYDMRVAHKNAMAIQNEFFTKFFGMVCPLFISLQLAKGGRNPQVVNELADCRQATFSKIFLFRLLRVRWRFLNGAKIFRVVRFRFGGMVDLFRRRRFFSTCGEKKRRKHNEYDFFHGVGFLALRVFG